MAQDSMLALLEYLGDVEWMPSYWNFIYSINGGRETRP